jgi:hypothetical protein
MGIIENSPERLRLRDRTWWVSLVCFAVALFLVGMFVTGRAPRSLLTGSAVWAAFGLAFLRGADVVFDRRARVMTLRRFSALGLRTTRLAFADIEGVRVDTRMLSPNSRRPSCRLTLATPTGELPLFAGYESGEERYERIRDAIRDALSPGRARAASEDPARVLAHAGRILEAASLIRQRDGLELAVAKQLAEAMAAEGPNGAPGGGAQA